MAYIAMEFHGTGDPYFGGSAEDRPLGINGAFIVGGYHKSEVAEFTTQEQAINAANAATNKRINAIIGAFQRA